MKKYLKYKVKLLTLVFLAAGMGVIFLCNVLAEDSLLSGFAKDDSSKESGGPVELNGDQVEFITSENKMIANGNVVVTQGTTKLTADKIEFSRDTQMAIAEGRVVLRSPQGQITGDKLVYDFGKKAGDFANAKIYSFPYYGAGETASKVSDNQIQIKNGYFTTCDLITPHFRMASKTVDIYPKDKLIARKVRMIVGKAPIMYIPKFVQRLDGKPALTYTPGYNKLWGMFLLTTYRFELNKNVKGFLHFDARERKDLAEGLDLDYVTPKTGSGFVRLYYMNERTIASKHFYQPRPSPTPEHERFKSEWRHRWEVDKKTNITLQYYKMSDNGIIKEYFKREYEKDGNPPTFFLLTRNMFNGTASFRIEDRVNRFTSVVERLPEIKYDISSQRIGDSGLYWRSENGFVNLSKKSASPTEIRKETMRVDSYNEISYPMRVSIIELNPSVGGRETFYSKTADPNRYNIMRGIFTTGASLSTKFYRTFDVVAKKWGMEINKIRHIITPSVSYRYTHLPTVPSSVFDEFDGIDTQDKSHGMGLSLENKLQTKRGGVAVDLLRTTLSTDFRLKEDRAKGGFGNVRTDIEFKPVDKIRFNLDTDYNSKDHRLSSANFEVNLNDASDQWYFNFGKRYSPDVDDQITTDLGYIINPKWKFSIYRRFDIAHGAIEGSVKAQEYTLTRDLHCWEMDINYNETRGSGSEIWIVFRLKAFPDMGFDFGNSFNKRKAGSQSGS